MNSRSQKVVYLAVLAGIVLSSVFLHAQGKDHICFRPEPGSAVTQPKDLRSEHGVLRVDLRIEDEVQPDGSIRYCYLDAAGDEAPTLRLHPGDLLILNLKNDLNAPAGATMPAMHRMSGQSKKSAACTSGPMNATATNLHFHGLTVPPVCHQDDVLNTSIQPGEHPFQYRFRIPQNEPPGLYWYHPHIHGYSKQEILGGASGAMIIEGVERADSAVVNLPEQVLVVRDQDLVSPAAISSSDPVLPRMLIDRDGDAANNGTGFGKPAKDLSINFVPVPFPKYPPAVIRIKPGERQLWRVLNASALTYLNLAVLFHKVPQPLGLVALDGVPLNTSGGPADMVSTQTHLGVPPGGRVEFIVQGPPAHTTGLLVTRTVDTGPGGENDPNRELAIIEPWPNAPDPPSRLDAHPQPLPKSSEPWLGNVEPVRTRKLYFSEKLADPNNPASATEFYLTVDGQKPQAFDPRSGIPNIVAQQGTVEDWIIENRSSELHAFHIHQLHFILMDYMGRPVNEPFLRDTINVPYYNGHTLEYPSVRLRMDFRDPNTVGTFPYHCHLLEHEDLGMMGIIRVDPPPTKVSK